MKRYLTTANRIKRFVHEVADYETYLITGEYPGRRPIEQVVYKDIYLEVRSETDGHCGESIRLYIDGPMVCEYHDCYKNGQERFGMVKSFRAYDKRNEIEDERLKSCQLVEWGHVGIVITCEMDTIVITSSNPKLMKCTNIDGKLHMINKCCECPYVDTKYSMCRYPNLRKAIPINDYETIMKDCPLRNRE